MAFIHGKNTGVLVGGGNLSAFFNEASASQDVETAETTTFGSSAKTYIIGLKDGTMSVSGMFDGAEDSVDEQIEAVAGHYAGLSFVAASQDFDAALAEKGAAIHASECDRCHSDGGSNAEDEASILAGQWAGYLRTAFAQYASGERPQDKKMKEKMELLSAADIEALIHFYASYR